MSVINRTERERRPGARRRGRELALAALYRADLLDLGPSGAACSLPEVLALHEEINPEKGPKAERVRTEALEYAHQLVTGLALERRAIDQDISELSTEWSLERLSITDRNILRIALWELKQGGVPAVIVDEAVELAKQYGGPDSPRFVNGILGAWLARHHAEEHEPHTPDGSDWPTDVRS